MFGRAFLVISALALTTSASSVMAAGEPNPAQGCFVRAGADVEIQVFDDIGNGDEGDFIDAFKLKKNETSELIIVENRKKTMWYKYRNRGGTTWRSKFQVVCKDATVFAVP